MTLLAYGVTGGAPPPLFERMVVEEDGAVEVVVRHGWPSRGRADEIGVYALPASEERAREFREVGPLPPPAESGGDAGSEGIVVGSSRSAWHPAHVPEPLTGLVSSLRALAQEARAHPRATLRAALEEGSLRLTAVGTQPIRVSEPTLRARPADGSEPDAVALIRHDPVVLDTTAHELAPGESLSYEVAAGPLDALVSVMWSAGDEPPQDGWLRPS